MTKIIAVTGATGAQGGGVINVLLKTPGWKVRAITRDPTGDKAKALAARGVEVVPGNLDDEESLVKAFEGASAVFGVTNFWEHLFAGKSADGAGMAEGEQALKLARAAARTSTLEHYIWSTLAGSKKLSGGKFATPHMDYKAEIDDKLKKEMPELVNKMTFLFFGYYPSNMAFFPMMKPFEFPGTFGKYAQVLPTPAHAKVPVTGDMTIAPGVWVRQILANPSITKGKYAHVAPETLSFGEILKVWSEVTGRPAEYLEVTKDAYSKLWGPPGKEFADQLVFGEAVEPAVWDREYKVLTPEQLGITKEELEGMGTRKALEAMKDQL